MIVRKEKMLINMIVSILTIIVMSYILITNPGYPIYIIIICYIISIIALVVLVASFRGLRDGI